MAHQWQRRLADSTCRLGGPTTDSSARRREAGKVAARCSPNHFCCGCGRERKASPKAKDSPQCQCHRTLHLLALVRGFLLAKCRVSIHIRETKDHLQYQTCYEAHEFTSATSTTDYPTSKSITSGRKTIVTFRPS